MPPDNPQLHAVSEEKPMTPNPEDNDKVNWTRLIAVSAVTAVFTAAATWSVTYFLERLATRKDREQKALEEAEAKQNEDTYFPSVTWPGLSDHDEDEEEDEVLALHKLDQKLDRTRHEWNARFSDMERNLERRLGRARQRRGLEG